MKKLNRGLARPPACLAALSHTRHNWNHMNLNLRKKKVWRQIYKFQGKFCAYCESPAEKGENLGHIEHFFNKGNPEFTYLTFNWNNLFGSCDSRGHCGHFKDQTQRGGKPRVYDPHKLIKPDVDDPEDFLQFLPSGRVQVKSGLDPLQAARAEETIRVLNLQVSTLVTSRNKKIEHYQKRLIALSEQEVELSDDEYDVEYLLVRDEAQTVAHRTAVKQAVF